MSADWDKCVSCLIMYTYGGFKMSIDVQVNERQPQEKNVRGQVFKTQQ